MTKLLNTVLDRPSLVDLISISVFIAFGGCLGFGLASVIQIDGFRSLFITVAEICMR